MALLGLYRPGLLDDWRVVDHGLALGTYMEGLMYHVMGSLAAGVLLTEVQSIKQYGSLRVVSLQNAIQLSSLVVHAFLVLMQQVKVR